MNIKETNNERRFRQLAGRYPHPHTFFVNRPYRSRREFFHLMGAGVTAAVLAARPAVGQEIKRGGARTQNKATKCIVVYLAGAPSHIDTFDFKQTPDTPMDVLKPETVNGIVWPTGIMPKLGQRLGDMAIVRSVRSWALQHTLAQTWAQIGRSPAAALGDIAPNIGSIVAVEKEIERKAGQVFPAFLALNSAGAVGSGYLPTSFAPLRITPNTRGLPDTANPDGQQRFESKYSLLNSLDGELRTSAPNGPEFSGYANFYTAGKAMMYNANVDKAFTFTAEESARYGNTGFGNACLLAQKVLAANGGTRYIQITLGGWDHHQDIYDVLPPLARVFDNGLAPMLEDLKASGALNETLVVVMGEFGRTVGRITGQDGRDHFLQQFAVFAGAGIRGGRTIGATSDTGAAVVESGWSRGRDIRPEDIEATIYSALGIDWTTIRYDDPFKRGFYYVPESHLDLYGPINELWG